MKHLGISILCYLLTIGGWGEAIGQDSLDMTVQGAVVKFFGPPVSFTSGQQVWDVESVDMDGDGDLDVVSISKNDRHINVHYNDGQGNLSQRATFPGPRDGRAVHTFDANGDGAPDVAAIGITEGLKVLLNDGHGRLRHQQTIPMSGMPHDVVALDLEGDGDLDLAAVAVWKHQVFLLVNDGSGNFRHRQPFKGGREPRRLLIADLDGDHQKDLLVGADDGKVWVYFRDENGRLNPSPKFISATANNWALAVADFNGDSLPDLAAGCYLDQSLSVHLNQGDRTFSRYEVLSGSHNFDLITTDLNQDGRPDLISCSTIDDAMHVHMNDGSGTFGNGIKLGSGQWNAGLSSGDLDGDGDIDLVTASVNDGMVNLHHNLYVDLIAPPPPPACLTGTVYSGEDSLPIGNAILALRPPQQGSRSTAVERADDSGHYRICPPLERNYLLAVQAPDWPQYREAFFMPSEPLEKDVYLFRNSFVQGYITDVKDGTPLPQAQVELFGRGNQLLATQQADTSGYYRFDIPFGGYHVRASYPEYQTEGRTFSLAASDVPDGKQVDIALTRPEIVCVRGVVTDEETSQPIPYAWVMVRDTFEVPVDSFMVDEKGRYRICLPYNHYDLATTAQGYFFNVSHLVAFPDESGTDIRHDIQLKPLAPQARIVLRNIYYDFDKWFLRPESITELNQLLKLMNDNPTLVVEISGHTDSRGSLDYNDLLSQRRAQSVVDYLLEHGIAHERMTAKGFGERQPMAPNDTDDNRQLNRRTEFKVLRY